MAHGSARAAAWAAPGASCASSSTVPVHHCPRSSPSSAKYSCARRDHRLARHVRKYKPGRTSEQTETASCCSAVHCSQGRSHSPLPPHARTGPGKRGAVHTARRHAAPPAQALAGYPEVRPGRLGVRGRRALHRSPTRHSCRSAASKRARSTTNSAWPLRGEGSSTSNSRPASGEAASQSTRRSAATCALRSGSGLERRAPRARRGGVAGHRAQHRHLHAMVGIRAEAPCARWDTCMARRAGLPRCEPARSLTHSARAREPATRQGSGCTACGASCMAVETIATTMWT